MQELFCAAAMVTCALAGSASAQAPVRAPIVLKVHHFLPPGSNAHAKLLAPWCERIEREAVGRPSCFYRFVFIFLAADAVRLTLLVAIPMLSLWLVRFVQ